MPLTPIDVQQKTFGPELRGYNMDEVDDFLDEVVAALKDYDQRVRDAQDRIRALESDASNRGEDESAISRALVSAQKQADIMVAEAKADSERILSEAHDEADRLRSQRETERMTLVQDIARMRAMVADLKRRVLELAGSIDTDLDEMDSQAAQVTQGLEPALPDEVAAYDEAGGSPVYETPVYRGEAVYAAGGYADTSEEEAVYADEAFADTVEQDTLGVDGGEDDGDDPYRVTPGSVDEAQVGDGLDPFVQGDDHRGGHLEDRPVPAHEDPDAVADDHEQAPEADAHEAADEDVAAEDAVAEEAAEEEATEEEAADEDSGYEDEPVAGRRPWERGSV